MSVITARPYALPSDTVSPKPPTTAQHSTSRHTLARGTNTCEGSGFCGEVGW